MKVKKPLNDHKKIGKTYIPPMAQLGIEEVSYINDLLPEIIWIGLILDCVGYRSGIKIFETFTDCAWEIHKKTNHDYLNLALCSSFLMFNDTEKVALVNKFEELNVLDDIRKYVSPILSLYEGCPLSFLGGSNNLIENKVLIERMRSCVDRYFSKYDQPGVILQTAAMYSRMLTGHLILLKNVEPPKLDSILVDFESEDAKRAASFVRATVIMEINPLRDNALSEWSKSFWDQGIRIDACKFGESADE